jgi:hypothetical protein
MSYAKVSRERVCLFSRYKNTGDYLKFFNDFIGETDNGRSSTRIADAFGLEITAWNEILSEDDFIKNLCSREWSFLV